MRRLSVALVAAVLFAVASQGLPAGAQLDLVESVVQPPADGGDGGDSGGTSLLGGLLDDGDDDGDGSGTTPDPGTVIDDTVGGLLPGDDDDEDPEEPTVDDPAPQPKSNTNSGPARTVDDDPAGDPAPAPAPAPAPTPVAQAVETVATKVRPSRSSDIVLAADTQTAVAGRTVASDSDALGSDDIEAAVDLPISGEGSPFGPLQLVAVLMVAGVMCAEFLYGVRRSTAAPAPRG